MPATFPEPMRQLLARGETRIVADDGDWTVSVKPPPRYLSKHLPAGAVLIANNGCGDQLFLAPDKADPGRFDPKVFVYWHDEPGIRLFAEDLGRLLNPPPAEVTKRPPVFYSDGQTPVQLGDEVSPRSFFLRRPGRVVYLPGISKRNRNLEHHGLGWVAIHLDNGTRIGTVVDPDTSRLRKSVRFVRRLDADFVTV